MNSYTIFTDSACDLVPSLLNELDVRYCCLTVTDANGNSYPDHDLPAAEFYQHMREGQVFKTSAATPGDFEKSFTEILDTGNDLLYIGFSSGLSTTVGTGRLVADDLKEKYPNQKIIVVDSLCASAGQGLLVYLAVQQKRAGKTIDEVAAYLEGIKLHICHWFTVDDLIYLRRGGRISAATQLAGSLLGIKPILHVDNEGHLISISKTRGRKNSLKAIADRYEALAVPDSTNPVFICHGDCIDDANELAAMVKERFGVTVEVTTGIGPVIGSHSGPGTLALFFVGKER